MLHSNVNFQIQNWFYCFRLGFIKSTIQVITQRVLYEKVCTRYCGQETLDQACSSTNDYISRKFIFKWFLKKNKICFNFARAPALYWFIAVQSHFKSPNNVLCFLSMSKGNDSLPLKKFSVSASCVPMIEVVSPQIMSRTRTPSSAFFLSSSPTVRLQRSSSVWLFSRRQSSILKKKCQFISTKYRRNRGPASSKTWVLKACNLRGIQDLIFYFHLRKDLPIYLPSNFKTKKGKSQVLFKEWLSLEVYTNIQ